MELITLWKMTIYFEGRLTWLTIICPIKFYILSEYTSSFSFACKSNVKLYVNINFIIDLNHQNATHIFLTRIRCLNANLLGPTLITL